MTKLLVIGVTGCGKMQPLVDVNFARPRTQPARPGAGRPVLLVARRDVMVFVHAHAADDDRPC